MWWTAGLCIGAVISPGTAQLSAQGIAYRGNAAKANCIVTDGLEPGDALAKALQDHVKSVAAPYKSPRPIEFVEELPETVIGKIQRVELREREWAHS